MISSALSLLFFVKNAVFSIVNNVNIRLFYLRLFFSRGKYSVYRFNTFDFSHFFLFGAIDRVLLFIVSYLGCILYVKT